MFTMLLDEFSPKRNANKWMNFKQYFSFFCTSNMWIFFVVQ